MASLFDRIWRPIVDTVYGWGGNRSLEVVRPDIDPAPTPATAGEQTARQDQNVSAGFGFAGGFGPAPRASLATYRDMLRQPTLALVRGTVFNDIGAGSWAVEADDDDDGEDAKAPAGAKELIEDAILPHRTRILRQALRAMDFGYAAFEVVHKAGEGSESIDFFKPLSPELTTILIEPTGKFVGIRNNQVRLYGPDCFLFTYFGDADAGDLYGRSRLESCRESVAKWIEVQTKIGQLMGKEAGVVTQVTFPPGTGRNDANSAVTNRTIAEGHAARMAAGSAWLAVENALAALTSEQRRLATTDQIIELLKVQLWKTEAIDLSGNGDSIVALQAYSAYLDVQIIRGYLRPERSLLEGTTGTKAEAGVHTDTGTTDSERIEGDIVEALNEQIVDPLLEQNYGPEARGTVRIKANPLRDVQEQIDSQLITAISTGMTTADEFYRTYDFDAIAERRGITKRKTPLPAPVQPTAAPGQPANGKPVNGSANGKAKAPETNLSRMLGELFGEDEHE